MALAQAFEQQAENRRKCPPGYLPRDPQKDPHLFGQVPVSPAQLKKKLGEVTWRVWWHCERVCSPQTGAYFMGAAKAAEELGISVKGLGKAMARLYRAGLAVVDHRRKNNRGAWVTSRRIRGQWADGPGMKAVLVPQEVWTWLNAPEKRGGDRSKRGSQSCTAGANGGRNPANGGCAILPVVRDPSVLPYGRTPVPGTTSNASLQAGMTPPAAQVLQPVRASDQPDFVPPIPGAAEVRNPDLGVGLRGNVPPGGRPPPPGTNGIPPFPGPGIMPPATVPGPPRLPPGADEAAQVDWLLKAYRGAVEARTKKPCWVLGRKGEAQKSKQWPALVKAAQLFIEFDWAPGAWVMWRLDSWAEMHSKASIAPLHWVFSVEAMETHGGWFQSEAGHYAAPRLVYNEAARRVLIKHQTMTMELMVRGARSRAAIDEVVAKHFPGSSFKELVGRANARTQEDQMLINQRIQHGSWVW